MEIIRSEVGATIGESMKQKFVKQICLLLETIQCHLERGFFGEWSLDNYVGKIIKSRYICLKIIINSFQMMMLTFCDPYFREIHSFFVEPRISSTVLLFGAIPNAYFWCLLFHLSVGFDYFFKKHILIQCVPLFLSKIANKRRKEKMGSEIQIVGAGFLSHYMMLLSRI